MTMTAGPAPMCEMLVRVVDKVNADSVYLDVGCTKRGDVIVIMEDGHRWSPAESAGDPWVIVKVPGVPSDKLAAYVVPEPGDPKQNRMLQRRAFRFDLDAHDGRSLGEKEAFDKKQPRPARQDPNVIGESAAVIR